MRKMISENQAKVIDAAEPIVNTIVIQNGKVGVIVDLPSKAVLNNNMAQVYEPTDPIATGIESIDMSGFAEGGPGGEIGTAEYSDLTSSIVVHLATENYRQTAYDAEVYGENLVVVDTRIGTFTPGGKGFKAFKLED